MEFGSGGCEDVDARGNHIARIRESFYTIQHSIIPAEFLFAYDLSDSDANKESILEELFARFFGKKKSANFCSYQKHEFFAESRTLSLEA
jgi:hypothetical protein